MSQATEIIRGQVSEAYGNAGYAKIIRHNENYSLVVDHWCGGDVEGICYREFSYDLPVDMVGAAVDAIRNGRDFIEGTTATEWSYWFETNIARLGGGCRR